MFLEAVGDGTFRVTTWAPPAGIWRLLGETTLATFEEADTYIRGAAAHTGVITAMDLVRGVE